MVAPIYWANKLFVVVRFVCLVAFYVFGLWSRLFPAFSPTCIEFVTKTVYIKMDWFQSPQIASQISCPRFRASCHSLRVLQLPKNTMSLAWMLNKCHRKPPHFTSQVSYPSQTTALDGAVLIGSSSSSTNGPVISAKCPVWWMKCITCTIDISIHLWWWTSPWQEVKYCKK